MAPMGGRTSGVGVHELPAKSLAQGRLVRVTHSRLSEILSAAFQGEGLESQSRGLFQPRNALVRLKSFQSPDPSLKVQMLKTFSNHLTIP